MNTETEPTRDQIDALRGLTLIELGASWCGYCRAARPLVDEELRKHPGIHRLWVEDGKGRKLGRSFGVRLWPTLILLRDGIEIGRVVRPNTNSEIDRLLRRRQ